MAPATWWIWFLGKNLSVGFQACPHAITKVLPVPSRHRPGAWPVSALQSLKEDAVKDTPPLASHALYLFALLLRPWAEVLFGPFCWDLSMERRGRRKPWRHYSILWLSICSYLFTPNPPPLPTSHIRIHNITKVFCWGLLNSETTPCLSRSTWPWTGGSFHSGKGKMKSWHFLWF